MGSSKRKAADPTGRVLGGEDDLRLSGASGEQVAHQKPDAHHGDCRVRRLAGDMALDLMVRKGPFLMDKKGGKNLAETLTQRLRED